MKGEIKSRILTFFFAVMIPVLFGVEAWQTYRYKKLQAEIQNLEKEQVDLVEENRKLISDISMLSSSDRIEKIAEDELFMHKAESEDIVRVEIKGK